MGGWPGTEPPFSFVLPTEVGEQAQRPGEFGPRTQLIQLELDVEGGDGECRDGERGRDETWRGGLVLQA